MFFPVGPSPFISSSRFPFSARHTSLGFSLQETQLLAEDAGGGGAAGGGTRWPLSGSQRLDTVDYEVHFAPEKPCFFLVHTNKLFSRKHREVFFLVHTNKLFCLQGCSGEGCRLLQRALGRGALFTWIPEIPLEGRRSSRAPSPVRILVWRDGMGLLVCHKFAGILMEWRLLD